MLTRLLFAATLDGTRTQDDAWTESAREGQTHTRSFRPIEIRRQGRLTVGSRSAVAWLTFNDREVKRRDNGGDHPTEVTL
jgi:hypothetical protein